MFTLTVICPVYNEEEMIAAFYQELKAVLLEVSNRYTSTILFVVDRCTDRSLEILKEIAARDPLVEVLALSSRFGHQMSLLAGIDHSFTDAAIMMDSDLQHPPQIIPQLLAGFEQGYDIVYTLREDSPEINFFKRTSSKLFYRFINRISDVPINESAADFRLVSRRVLEIFQQQIRERNQFLRGLFGWVGFNSLAVPFKVRKRAAGKSKYSVARMIRFGTDGVISFSKSPLQAATYSGFALAFLGFILAFAIVIQFIFSHQFPSGWSILTVLISIFSGTQLIFLGILGQYIGAIFDEVKGRPHYIVQEKINFAASGGGKEPQEIRPREFNTNQL